MRDKSTIAFLAGTFGGAWLLWGYWVVAMPPGGLQISPAFVACAITGGFAPSLAALAVSWLQRHGSGVRQLLAPLFDWRFGALPWIVAIVAGPAAAVASVAGQAQTLGALRWPAPELMVMALAWPVMAALGEELGWRGFLLPRLARRFGLLLGAIVVGLIWGVWHLPADYIALKGYGDLFWLAFLLNGPVVLTGHSIILAWLWKRTNGSTLVAVVYHIGITASAITAPTAGSDGLPGVLAASWGAATVWAAAIVLLLLGRAEFGLISNKAAGRPLL